MSFGALGGEGRVQLTLILAQIGIKLGVGSNRLKKEAEFEYFVLDD